MHKTCTGMRRACTGKGARRFPGRRIPPGFVHRRPHIDFGFAKFLSGQVQVGAVGYFYQQLTGDSGEGATLGAFKSRVAGIGPQFGHFFPAGRLQGYVNLKGYCEVAAESRPEGWNVWLSVAFSPPMPEG